MSRTGRGTPIPPSRVLADMNIVPEWYYDKNNAKLQKAAAKLSRTLRASQKRRASEVRRRLPSVPPALLPSPPSTIRNRRNEPNALEDLAMSEALNMMLWRLGQRPSKTGTHTNLGLVRSLPKPPKTRPGVTQMPTGRPKTRGLGPLASVTGSHRLNDRNAERHLNTRPHPKELTQRNQKTNDGRPKPNSQKLPNVPTHDPILLRNVPTHDPFLKKRVQKLVEGELYNAVIRHRNKNHEQVFGSDLCGWAKTYKISDIWNRLTVIMPRAYFHTIVISKRGTSNASFINYNIAVEDAKSTGKRYMITFVFDYCSEHASVVFHAFFPDRLFYFNSEVHPELRDFVRYATGRELVFLDYEPFQEDQKKTKTKDVFCIMHSAAFSYALYKHFETTRPLGSPINNELDPSEIPWTVNSSKPPTGKKLTYEADVTPIYRAYVQTIYQNQTPLPSLAEFLLKLKKATQRSISQYVNKTDPTTDLERNTNYSLHIMTKAYPSRKGITFRPSHSHLNGNGIPFRKQLWSVFDKLQKLKNSPNKPNPSKPPVFKTDGTVKNTNALRNEIIARRIARLGLVTGLHPSGIAPVRVFQNCSTTTGSSGNGGEIDNFELLTHGIMNTNVNTATHKSRNKYGNKSRNKSRNQKKTTNQKPLSLPNVPAKLPIAQANTLGFTSAQLLSNLKVKRDGKAWAIGSKSEKDP